MTYCQLGIFSLTKKKISFKKKFSFPTYLPKIFIFASRSETHIFFGLKEQIKLTLPIFFFKIKGQKSRRSLLVFFLDSYAIFLQMYWSNLTIVVCLQNYKTCSRRHIICCTPETKNVLRRPARQCQLL